MRAGLTGHTRGLGKALYDAFSLHCDVTGFSRATGHELSEPDSVNRIYDECKDYDLFINNAWHPRAQFDLLKKFHSEWSGTDKKIINISSSAIFQDPKEHSYMVYGYPYIDYYTTKTEMKQFFNDNIFNDSPMITNVVIGLLDTFAVPMPKMRAIEVANYIKSLTFNEHGFNIREVVLMPRKEI